jgi:hypothetical protein
MNKDPIEWLIHELKSKCFSFSGAAEMLRTVSDKEKEELLVLIEQNARLLARASGKALRITENNCKIVRVS